MVIKDKIIKGPIPKEQTLINFSEDLGYVLRDEEETMQIKNPKDEEMSDLALIIDWGYLRYSVRAEFKSDPDLDALIEFADSKGRMTIGKAFCPNASYITNERSITNQLNYEFIRRGIEVINVPKFSQNDKDLADQYLICETMEILFERSQIEIFVLVSGDIHFLPLIRKLKEHGKKVILIGLKKSTAKIMTKEPDEYVDYATLHSYTGKSTPLQDTVKSIECETKT